MCISKPINTKHDAIVFITGLVEQKRSFHYDDPVEAIANAQGERLFSDQEVPLINQRVEELFGFEFCPFELTMKIQDDIWNKDEKQQSVIVFWDGSDGEQFTIERLTTEYKKTNLFDDDAVWLCDDTGNKRKGLNNILQIIKSGDCWHCENCTIIAH